MPVPDQHVAHAIIAFLRLAVKSKTVAEDYAESMDVAIDCIADAFSVDASAADSTVTSVFGGKLLPQLLELASTSSAATSSATAASPAVSAQAKEEADKLKVLGNNAMAQRNFTEAIAKYTDAIALDPTNVVYFSNRAAAYTSNQELENAVRDAERAIELDPSAPKPYSRLGLAQFSLGRYEEAMQAYERGLAVEGSSKLDAMQRGYDTSKQRYQEQLEKSMSVDLSSTDKSEGSEPKGAGGMPDFSSMFGGGGGMPNLGELMQNPQIMQAAQQMMSNPDALQNLMKNPALKLMAESMGLGGQDGNGPDFSKLMNQFGGGPK